MSQRKRASHFALMDTAFAADRKFVRLAARAKLPVEYAAAVGVYWLILADCRRSKSPAVKWGEYEEYEPQIQLLQAVGLLEEGGFPADSFEEWAPAYKSPWDTQRNAAGREGTQRYDTSVHISSTRGEGGVGEAGLWHGSSTHDGRHGERCGVCMAGRKTA